MKVVIVGNGVAGVTTARLAVERDPSLDVTIYSEEPYHYYSRPRLVDLVGGQVTPADIQVYPEEWYAERHIRTVLNTRVTHLEPAEHRITLPSGETVSYDRLVLATGARAWVPPIAGADAPGVYTLRTMDDAVALRDAATPGRRVLVLGGGLLGLEVAAALSGRGVEVTVVEVFPRLLPRQLDQEGAEVLEERIERNGVEILTGDSCSAIEPEGPARVCKMKSGGMLEADLVVVSAGARSNVALAQEADIVCARGIVVDEHLQTSAPDVYAVGDAAEFEGRVWGIIPAALAEARLAAAQVTGDESATYHDIVPSTTLKVTGIEVTSIGEVNPETPGAVEIRAVRPGEGVYDKLVLRDGKVVGAIMVGSRANLRAVNLLMSRGTDVSAYQEELLQDGFDLLALAQQRTPA